MGKKNGESSIGFFEKSAFRFQASNFRGSMASDTELTQQVPKWTAKSLGGEHPENPHRSSLGEESCGVLAAAEQKKQWKLKVM